METPTVRPPLHPPDDRRPVLILFAESLAGPESAWSLLEAGYRVVALTRQGTTPPLARCKAIEVVGITPPEQDVHRAIEDVTRLSLALEAVAIMALDDTSIWLCDAASAHLEIPVAGPTGQQARLALDKRIQLDAAGAAGFNVPPTEIIATREQALELSEFPLVLKPACTRVEVDGRLQSQSGAVCANRAELEKAAQNWDAIAPLLAQPFVRGVGEGLFGFATNDAVMSWSGHRRVRMMNPAGSGSSACISTPVDGTLLGHAEQFLLAQQWQGLFMIELLREESGQVWFIELNGRAWGSMALARRLGFEYPAWTVMQLFEPSFRPPAISAAEPVLCRNLGREILHLLFVLRGPSSKALTEWPSRLGALRDVLRFNRRDRWYNYRPGDLSVFLVDAAQTVAGPFRKKWKLL